MTIKHIEAPVAPFIVARCCWAAQDIEDASLSMEGWSWMGWMAKAPPDWSGLSPLLGACAPPKAMADLGIGLSSEDVKAKMILFPMRPDGANAPWLSSEETVYHDMSSPRILELQARWVIPANIPREWSDQWHQEMTRVALGQTKEPLERALRAQGFEQIEFMGEFADVSGASYWCNVANRLWPQWQAREQAADLERSVALASGADTRVKSI